MSIRSVAKKTWPILVIFALAGLGLGIGLAITGIFAPFGMAVGGVILIGVLLCLAGMAAAALLMLTIGMFLKEAKEIVPRTKTTTTAPITPAADLSTTPVTAPLPTPPTTLPTPEPTKNLNPISAPTTTAPQSTEPPIKTATVPTTAATNLGTTPATAPPPAATVPPPTVTAPLPTAQPPLPSSSSVTTVHPPPLQTAPPPQPLPVGKQSEKDAEAARDYIRRLAQPGQPLSIGNILMSDCFEWTLDQALKKNAVFWVAQIPNENQYTLRFQQDEAFRASLWRGRNLVPPHYPPMLSEFKKKADEKWGDGTVTILSDSSAFSAEISPEKIQVILHEMQNPGIAPSGPGTKKN